MEDDAERMIVYFFPHYIYMHSWRKPILVGTEEIILLLLRV